MSVKVPSRYVFTGQKLSGGMGDVRIYEDSNLKRNVAIKFIRDVEDMDRLLDEISALQKIRSKHVVEIYDIVVGESEEDIGIVQDYLPGKDLLFLANERLSDEEYLRVLYQIASGISDIHEQGVIHRDIKPNNMKFDQEKLIKIFDFGLARTKENAKTVGFRGTTGFAAPELYSNGTVSFTKAIDTYAFGATALYITEGSLPRNLLKKPPKRPAKTSSFTSLSVSIPAEIAKLLDSTLSENPEDRPEMSDIRDAIARHLLFGKHKALVVSGSEAYSFNKVGQNINIGASGMGKIQINYDGLVFQIGKVSGDVFVNNKQAKAGQVFPGSCVITIGTRTLDASRKFVTFDISHPEVVL